MSESAMEHLALVDQHLSESLRTSMAEVEVRLRDTATDSPDPLIGEAAAYLTDAGGKRWRPLLVLLGARFGDPGAASVTDAAVMVELIHAASLYHDDVMDEAPLRHNVPSAQLRWGNKIAILVGDHLFARGATISLGLRAGLTTLPTLYALRDEGARSLRLRALLDGGSVDDPNLHAEALELLRGSPAMATTRLEVERYATEARYAANRLQDSPARQVLESLCDLVVSRSA